MLFWKRLCRPQGEPPAPLAASSPSTTATSSATLQRRPASVASQERRFFGILRAGKRKDATSTAPPIYQRYNNNNAGETAGAAAPIGYQVVSAQSLLDLQSPQNDYVLESPSELANLRLRSPPPLYCPQPLTPPPCYTERPAAPPPPAPAAAAALAPTAAEHAATAAATTAAARQQARRRRRLRELQQQQQLQQQLQHFASSTNSTTASSSNSSDQSSDNDCALGGNSSRRQRRRRRSSRGLRDAYCPDLLHACALILHQQQPGSSDSSVGNFTATPPPPPRAAAQSEEQLQQQSGFEYSSDYVEIDELLPLGAGRAKSTPQLQHAVGLDSLAMGQNLSLRRPRISLTWVLREQHQPQPQQPTTPAQSNEGDTEQQQLNHPEKEPIKLNDTRTEPVPTQLDVTKKRYRVKQLPNGGTEPLNGYATTPTAHQAPGNGQLANQKFFSNQNLLDYKDKAVSRGGGVGGSTGTPGAPIPAASTKELLFVCTPQRAPKSDMHSEALLLARKRNEIRKKLANRLQQARSCAAAAAGGASAASVVTGESAQLQAKGATATTTTSATTADALKCTYSEPSLVAVSEGGGGAPQQQRRHRHRKRRERERNRVQRFGYEIHNVDEFLSRCSLAAPGNIPVVLATASTLYQTRPGGYQLEIPLPLGMVVNAVFKNQNWLYVQTPHAEEGYVGYACCLPLGILPSAARGSKHTPCWESNADIFPRPCGNMTDSEKEIRLRGGTRSDGARTPRSSSKPGEELLPHNNNNNNNNNNSKLHATSNGSSLAGSLYGEQHVDKLYLRAASQPKLVEKAYAQLRSTKQLGSCSASVRSASNDEYVTLQQQQQRTTKHAAAQKHQHPQGNPLQPVRRLSNVSYITNGHNGQHLHPKNIPHQQHQQQQSQQQQQQPTGAVLSVLRRHQQNGLRQTLVAINADYITESIVVHKGEIVTLCECRESKDQRQWFYVKTRDGREGFIPAEVAGHGYL